MAIGIPSRRAQIRSTRTSLATTSGLTALARWKKSVAAGAAASDRTDHTCSPSTPSGSRLVTMTRNPTQRCNSDLVRFSDGVEEMFGVVEDHQDRPRADRLDDRLAPRPGGDQAHCGTRQGSRSGRVSERRHLDEPQTVRVHVRRLQARPRWPAWSCRRLPARSASRRPPVRATASNVLHLCVSADKRRQLAPAAHSSTRPSTEAVGTLPGVRARRAATGAGHRLHSRNRCTPRSTSQPRVGSSPRAASRTRVRDHDLAAMSELMIQATSSPPSRTNQVLRACASQTCKPMRTLPPRGSASPLA